MGRMLSRPHVAGVRQLQGVTCNSISTGVWSQIRKRPDPFQDQAESVRRVKVVTQRLETPLSANAQALVNSPI